MLYIAITLPVIASAAILPELFGTAYIYSMSYLLLILYDLSFILSLVAYKKIVLHIVKIDS